MGRPGDLAAAASGRNGRFRRGRARPGRRFKSAALATGAFPVGLAARVIDAEASDFGIAGERGAITGGAWPINLKPGLSPDTRPKPNLLTTAGVEAGPSEPVLYVAVDGGVANNEPFEFARYALRQLCDNPATGAKWARLDDIPDGESYLAPNPRDPDAADSAVLMIDPFPEGPTYTALTPDEAHAQAGIVSAARKLIPALVNQARFKPGELIEATDTRVFSRYLLSPSRREQREDAAAKLGADAIACGSFGGFGGFFDRSFRAHDYMLGQRNARSFLQNYFNLHPSNPILGLKTEEDRVRMSLPWPDGPIERRVPVVQPGDHFYPADAELPPWPRLAQDRLDPILDHAEDRIAKIAGKMLKDLGFKWSMRLALGAVWSLGPLSADKKIGGLLRGKVVHELIRRDQHEDFKELARGRPFAPWQRVVLTSLAAAGDEPIRIRLPEAERCAAREGKKKPRDLLAALEDRPAGERAGEEEIRAFLNDQDMQGRIWRTPWRDAKDKAYTLAVLRPAWPWMHNVMAVRDRIWGFFDR